MPKRKRNFEKGTATKNRKKKRKNTDEKEETRKLDPRIDKILTEYEEQEKRSRGSKKNVLPTDSLYVQSGYVSDDYCDPIEKKKARDKDTRDFIPNFCIRD
tara:strand:- start:206 stop:508 length:303 start_codon:yes stop_codon:yes gene_type:complete